MWIAALTVEYINKYHCLKAGNYDTDFEIIKYSITQEKSRFLQVIGKTDISESLCNNILHKMYSFICDGSTIIKVKQRNNVYNLDLVSM